MKVAPAPHRSSSLASLAILGLFLAARAHAAVYVVNSNDDVDNGACDAVHCSLREAIEAANVNAGPDDIHFNISPGGVQLIVPTSALPPLADAVNLDATSQPGYAGSPLIQLRGSMAGATSGLEITAGSCTVKGLSIFDFALNGILVRGPGLNVVSNNFLGIGAFGIGIGNAGNGIQITDSPNNRVKDNIISSNGDNGVLIQGGGATGNRVVGNKIGTAASGSALGNTLNGVLVEVGASSNVIGDLPSGDENTIGYNGLAGVAVTSGSRNSIRHNSIHSNAGLGIDLDVAGVTLDDGNDPDSGANMLQNYPLLRYAHQSGSFTLVDWRLNSTPLTSFTIELFSNSTCDPSAHGEGQTYLGQSSATTDASGFTPAVTVALPQLPIGYYITATATDPGGNTSEFSLCEQVN
ncbi:MAG TPA: CSLREA domain-containing protein [Myxococcales bacterium]|nr:CSLREA domain-containing protein [Myxococcales bacterium]